MKAIVTGHTQGLGAALAAGLMARGIAVLGLARGHAPALAAAYPRLLTEVALDLSDSAALARWLAGGALAHHLDHPDGALLINNAGVVQPIGALAVQDPLEVARAITVNVTAPLMLAAAVAGLGGQRRIVHISSGAGRNAYPGWSVYCAGKAALDHHARAVALDADAGLRICSLAPGVIDTPMQASIRATPEARFPLRERFIALQRDGLLVSPEDCAGAVIDYLLAEQFGQSPVDDLRSVGR